MEEEPRRPASDTRRLSYILAGPEMRSMRLIGHPKARYQWERYWKTQAELHSMTPAIRQYYERTNNLVQQYLFIDQLLDSSIPLDLLDEYEAELEASAYRPAVPSIYEDRAQEEAPSPPHQPHAKNGDSSDGHTSRSNDGSLTTLAANALPTKKQKRSAKDIFKPPVRYHGIHTDEETPLLDGPFVGDVESGFLERSRISQEEGDFPRPHIPWVEDAEVDSSDPVVAVAIWVNMLVNLLLLMGKIAVVMVVPSMSVLASLVDAMLDFLSTAIVWTTTRLIASSQLDKHAYPIGRSRLEPLGILVFSVIMITSFAQVGLESLQRLFAENHVIIELGPSAIGIMLATILIKGALWCWCRLVKNSSVRALADDAYTDVIFNTGSILFPLVGFYARIWWLDALGGLLLSIVVVMNWTNTSLHHVRNLTGVAAAPDERNMLLYLTMRFATTIKQIQNLHAYHAGDKINVEADIVLAANTPLKDSHDLSEVLTYFLESVPIVDRAFVHVDYLSYNAPTHI